MPRRRIPRYVETRSIVVLIEKYLSQVDHGLSIFGFSVEPRVLRQ
jgi:hypothetical protein